MKASVERRIIRWLHILISIPIVGYIYGPISGFPGPTFVVRWVMFPILVLSGFWLWKGHLVRKWFRKRSPSRSVTV